MRLGPGVDCLCNVCVSAGRPRGAGFAQLGSPGSPPRSNCRAPETQVRRRKAARYMLTAGTARAPRVSERPGPVQRCYGVSCLVSRRVRYVYTMEYVRPRPRSAGPSAKARVCGAGPGAGWVPAPGGEPHAPDHNNWL